ncbi:lamin tail domain-containing protein [Chloroflexota bacterium]
MNSKPRWFYYILLNIIVSAVVTLTVVLLYDNYKGAQVNSAIIATPSQVSQSVPVILSQVNLEIISVIGSGVVVTEVVVIQNKGDDAVTLTGWTLMNGSRSVYVFPQVKMFKDGMLQVHSVAGANTAVDLYLGRTEPAWQSGDVASIVDTQGNLVTTYLIP